jgi:histidinol-phosphate aminotransferase
MHGYVPGEQPQSGHLLKLNTNESPYPPSPRVAEAIRALLEGDRLRLYPDPMSGPIRHAAAARHGLDPSWILAGNGSDDLLTILTRTFVAPDRLIVAPTPSYLLYSTLAELQGARIQLVPFQENWTLSPEDFAVPDASLTFLANPNSPSGTALTPDQVSILAERIKGPLVVDEAYAEFADSDCVELVKRHANVIITRTLSKAYGLAGLRVGYLIARPELIEQFAKVKDSYNCDVLSQFGGAAALEDQEYQQSVRNRILGTRERLATALRALGYRVPHSQANFLWCEGGLTAQVVEAALRKEGILVRLMQYPGHPPTIRISVGTDAQIDRLLAVMHRIHDQESPRR